MYYAIYFVDGRLVLLTILQVEQCWRWNVEVNLTYLKIKRWIWFTPELYRLLIYMNSSRIWIKLSYLGWTVEKLWTIKQYVESWWPGIGLTMSVPWVCAMLCPHKVHALFRASKFHELWSLTTGVDLYRRGRGRELSFWVRDSRLRFSLSHDPFWQISRQWQEVARNYTCKRYGIGTFLVFQLWATD